MDKPLVYRYDASFSGELSGYVPMFLCV